MGMVLTPAQKEIRGVRDRKKVMARLIRFNSLTYLELIQYTEINKTRLYRTMEDLIQLGKVQATKGGRVEATFSIIKIKDRVKA